MIEDFLKDIYDNAFALEFLKEVSYYSQIRQSYKAREIWNGASNCLSNLIANIKKSDEVFASVIASDIRRAKECFTDRSGFASIIDFDIIPKVSEYLEKSAVIDAGDDSWSLLSSKTGFLTLKDRNGVFLHSYSDPMWENFLIAQNIYDPYVTRYNILGGGLGYLAYQLWRLSEGDADIYVYEINNSVKDYSDLYGVMSYIDDEHIHVIYDENKDWVIEQYLEEVPNNKIIRTISYWDSECYSGVYSDCIERIRSSEFTSRVFDSRWKRNYSFNLSLPHFRVSEFDSKKLKDEWVVVAAGPSLNDNAEFIEKSIGKRTVCAINTSLKWFSSRNIIPDICFACDPNKSLVPYIDGCREFSREVPLIADYVTNHNYLELYMGPRYYTVTDASSLIIDKEYDEQDVWSFGGTVTSMAIEAAYKMGAKKIYLVGADLSYPGRTTYAEGVGAKNGQWNSDEEMVASVDDTMVPTSKVFSEYISQIEDQISEHPGCEVINKSLHGAYIRGTFCGKWWEDLINSGSTEKYLCVFEELKKDSYILGWREKYYIFWQAVSAMESKKIIPGDQDGTVIESAYENIFAAFNEEMNIDSNAENVINDSLTYIFTSEFWDNNDDHTKKVLNIAKSETNNRKKVLIINSSEKMGGSVVPIHNAVAVKYNDNLENAGCVNYENRSFPYFQLSKGMPDTDYYKVFLNSISNNIPNKIYITSKYSLLADYCALKFKVTVEYE